MGGNLRDQILWGREEIGHLMALNSSVSVLAFIIAIIVIHHHHLSRWRHDES